MKRFKGMKIKIVACALSMMIVFSMAQIGVKAETVNEVWVNGVNIVNAEGQTVKCGNGTATYEEATNTLTLNNVQITNTNTSFYAIENKKDKDFTVLLQGNNSIDIDDRTGVFGYTAANITFSGGGSLDIQAPQSISNAKNITFDDVDITASASSDGAIVTDGNITIKNNASIICSGTYFAFNALGNITITQSIVEATATAEYGNAFSIIDNIVIENNASVSAISYYPSLWTKNGDIAIENSSVKAESTHDMGIWSNGDLTILGHSEVVAKGKNKSAGSIGAFNIIPALNEKVEVYVGTKESDVTALEGSPFMIKTDLKHHSVSDSSYFYSKAHTHIFGDWVVDTVATEISKGSKHRACACGHIETTEIAMKPSIDEPSTEGPNTGDSTNVVFAFGMLIFSTVVFVIARKRVSK